jgi:single-strand DNA-binding protein
VVNKVILVGNLGQDPEIRYAQSGNKIASFSIATTDSWKDKATGERKTQTQWHRIVVFNENLADIVEKYVKKGSKLYIEGALQSRKYTGTDGVEKNITEIVLSQFRGEIQLLDSRNSESSNNYEEQDMEEKPVAKKAPAKAKPKEDFSNSGEDLDDEIPF